MREERPESTSLLAKLSKVIATKRTSESYETPVNEREEPVDIEHEFEELMAQVNDVDGEFSHSGHCLAMIGAQIQIAVSPSFTCRSNSVCHVR
ncbi:hypothetical protein EL22_28550 [Halostagnicola sp. A56]|uniref:hypothetical protein n=1 Tax=Halostagnicola sp. A56 TaxID=1495067 RepID=UPI00065F6A23|nr:hypothetical protein [Halostagnicola sp. A56]KMT45690.1 hypothetical protein EL22_28550 [Halostagnicola sp. A56]